MWMTRAVGLLGAAALVVGDYADMRLPTGTWADHGIVHWWRHRPDHIVLGMVVSAVGLALLAAAWGLLVRRCSGATDGVGVAVRTATLWCVPLFAGPPLFSGDAWSYVANGYLAGHGRSPYVTPPAVLAEPLSSGVHPVWQHTLTPYGPLGIEWGALWSRVTADPWLLLVCHRVLAFGAVVLLAWALTRLARATGRDAGFVVSLVVASPFVVAHGVGGAHNDVVLAALGTAALALAVEGRWLIPAALVGLAAAVKIPAALFGVGVILVSIQGSAGWLRRLRRAIEVGAVAGVTLLAVGWASGLGNGWMKALGVPGERQSRLAILSLLHIQGASGALILIAGAVVLLLWPTRPGAALVGAGVAMLATTLLSPVVHYWYFLWCLPVLVAAPLRRRWAAAVVGLVIALSLNPVADADLGQFWVTRAGELLVVLLPFAMAARAAPPRNIGRS